MLISKRALKRGKDSIINGYKNTSIIREVIDCRSFVEKIDRPGNYTQIGLRTLVPKDWFKATANVVLEFGSIGRSVAMGEENFLIDRVQEEIPEKKVRRIDKFAIDNVARAVTEIKGGGYSPSVLFVPIEFFVEMHNWRLTSNKMAIRYPSGPRAFLVLDESTKLRIFWSSKYVRLDKILILDRSFAEWIVKTEPKTGDYIQATIRESKEPDKMEIMAKTVVKLIMRKSKALQILAPAYIPKMQRNEKTSA